MWVCECAGVCVSFCSGYIVNDVLLSFVLFCWFVLIENPNTHNEHTKWVMKEKIRARVTKLKNEIITCKSKSFFYQSFYGNNFERSWLINWGKKLCIVLLLRIWKPHPQGNISNDYAWRCIIKIELLRPQSHKHVSKGNKIKFCNVNIIDPLTHTRARARSHALSRPLNWRDALFMHTFFKLKTLPSIYRIDLKK